jgi:NAD(P)-dependent dehydrogenase (short-subunit alcohol dehydrogenase family)
MKVVITGGAGFLGKKLARRILQQGTIAGPDGKPAKVGELLLFDVGKASGPGLDDPRVKALAGDIANTATVQSIVQGASTVFHFAAVVSAGAEADFDLGYRVNLDGTRNVLEACRALGTNPRVVFTSSLAAYGGDLPPAVTDDTPLTPQTSCGAQKSIGDSDPRLRAGFLRGTADAAADDLRAHQPAARPPRPGRARWCASRSPGSTWFVGDAADHHGGVEPAQDGRRLHASAICRPTPSVGGRCC